MKQTICVYMTVFFWSLSLTAAPPSVDDSPPGELALETLTAWRTVIEPNASESEYLNIDWETSIRDGVRRADEERKPLLIYVMNGHPLGCT